MATGPREITAREKLEILAAKSLMLDLLCVSSPITILRQPDWLVSLPVSNSLFRQINLADDVRRNGMSSTICMSYV